MLQRLSEADLLRMEFADFCHAQGGADYDYTSYHSCAAQQFMRSREHQINSRAQALLYDYARVRPWNFGELAYRLALAEGK